MSIVFLFAVVLSCDPQVEEVIQGEDVVLEAGLTDYIELLKCLLGHEELIKDVTDVYEAIVAGDYQKLLALAMKLYTDGKAAIPEGEIQEIKKAGRLASGLLIQPLKRRRRWL